MNAKTTQVRTVALAFAFAACAAFAGAETTIELYPPGVAPEYAEPKGGLEKRGAALDTPGNFFIIPYYEANTVNANDRATLMSVRNESTTTSSVVIDVYDEFGVLYRSVEQDLLAKETYTANLRDLLAGQPGVPDGVVTGWIDVLSPSMVSVDYFQVYPNDAFATGDTAFKASSACDDYKIRFLIGGGFDGGTQVIFHAFNPMGGDAATDPPTITGQVYDEAGNPINTFAIFTDEVVSSVPAALLVDAPTNFGTIDVDFEANGGLVTTTHDASGRYSVGLKGYCLDPV